MKNNDCVIYITTKRGYAQVYRKDNAGWIQTGPNGIVRRMTAEQLLSHLLPPLTVENRGRLVVKVEKRKRQGKMLRKKGSGKIRIKRVQRNI